MNYIQAFLNFKAITDKLKQDGHLKLSYQAKTRAMENLLQKLAGEEIYRQLDTASFAADQEKMDRIDKAIRNLLASEA